MREVAGLLEEYRLVTVTGPGGVGKTRLAGEVARQVAGRFADGVWLAELAPVQDPGQVPAAVAAALGVREQPGVPAAGALARVLARQQLLLVLDNCEHVIGAAAGLCAELVAACDDVQVLATSREPLRVAGEARYRLAPLALPGQDDLADVGRAEAVALFADRARQADVGFVLDGRTGPEVARLVARLDGMPLAIELAAARVEALGVASCWTVWMTGSRCWPAGTGWRRPGSGRWPPPWSGVTGCWMSRSGGCSARCRCSRRPFTLEAAEAVAGAGAGPAVLRLVDCSLLGPPQTGRGWPVPVCDAGDAARLRGPAAGRQGRGAGRGRGCTGRVRAGGGGGGGGRAADEHRGGGRRAVAGRRGRHRAAGAGLGHGPRCGHRPAAGGRAGAVVVPARPDGGPVSGARRGRRARRPWRRRVVRRAVLARYGGDIVLG